MLVTYSWVTSKLVRNLYTNPCQVSRYWTILYCLMSVSILICLLSTVLCILLVDLWYHVPSFIFNSIYFQLSDKYDIMEREFNSLKVFLNYIRHMHNATIQLSVVGYNLILVVTCHLIKQQVYLVCLICVAFVMMRLLRKIWSFHLT